MADNLDVRWKQRFSNYKKALSQLTKFIDKFNNEGLNEFEKQGLIQAFEYTYELAWNVLKDFFEHQGVESILGSRDAFKLAYNGGLIENGDIWQDMVTDRRKTSHTYNEAVSEEIAEAVLWHYYPQFQKLSQSLESLIVGEKE